MTEERKKALSVAQVFAYRLRDARLTKRWKQQDLAEAMSRIGHPINRATIAKIEAGARGVGGEVHGPTAPRRGQTTPRPVSLEEAIAFAVALDVPPPSLFLPIFDVDDVQLTPAVRATVEDAHAWVRGEAPLAPDNQRFYRFQTFGRREAPPITVEQLEALGIGFNQPGPRGMLRTGDKREDQE